MEILCALCVISLLKHFIIHSLKENAYFVLDADQLQSKSGWVPLLLALLHEYTSPESLWRPYVDLVPDFTQLDLPMFWSE